MIAKTSTEARYQLIKLLDVVQREPVVITRRGRLAAFMISASDMELLRNPSGESSRTIKELEAWRKKAKERTRPEGQALSKEEVDRIAKEIRRARV
ncbi:MAG: type II toxin-antitoxin system prevent-host-death family antitoxin [Terracidiphilus sp.]|jgi:prevent-host-death family protein